MFKACSSWCKIEPLANKAADEIKKAGAFIEGAGPRPTLGKKEVEEIPGQLK